MSKPTRFVGERNGERYLLEETIEFRKTNGNEWVLTVDLVIDWMGGAEGSPFWWGSDHTSNCPHKILQELCKIEAPEGYTVVNDGIDYYTLASGDKFIALDGAGVDWNDTCEASDSDFTVRAPVCRLIEGIEGLK